MNNQFPQTVDGALIALGNYNYDSKEANSEFSIK